MILIIFTSRNSFLEDGISMKTISRKISYSHLEDFVPRGIKIVLEEPSPRGQQSEDIESSRTQSEEF